jgi:hypothetical protein
MLKSTFDPTVYHFVETQESDDIKFWETHAIPDGEIGSYKLRYDIEDDWWTLFEIVYHNDNPKDITLYCGRIPDDVFSFQLFKNMELWLPIIQREIKIDSIL